MSDFFLLSAIIFLPAIGALGLGFFHKDAHEPMRIYSFVLTAVTFVLTLFLLGRFDPSKPEIQLAVNIPWIQTWNINYQLGVDGISLPLVLLTSLISMLAMLASWSIQKQVRGY